MFPKGNLYGAPLGAPFFYTNKHFTLAFYYYSGTFAGKTTGAYIGQPVVEGYSHTEFAGFIRGVQSPIRGETAPPIRNTYSGSKSFTYPRYADTKV